MAGCGGGGAAQICAFLTLETLASTPSGVTSPTTVTFFAAKSMLNVRTPSETDAAWLSVSAILLDSEEKVYDAHLPSWRGASSPCRRTLCSAGTPSAQPPATMTNKLIKERAQLLQSNHTLKPNEAKMQLWKQTTSSSHTKTHINLFWNTCQQINQSFPHKRYYLYYLSSLYFRIFSLKFRYPNEIVK